jgi:hypothetical protein
MTPSPFPVVRPHQLPVVAKDHHWLIDHLWADQAVGIVGGEPKCGKSFLALDMAVAVGAGLPCLGRFTAKAGPVLLFAAEDALHVVRARLQSIAAARGIALDAIDLHVITAPTVRLDLDADRQRLQRTVEVLRPKLLLLDPFVRLHRRDENVSAEVAPLLAFLRELQRRFALAVVVVHHAKKAAGKLRAGQALRGSSEFHAWGDSNLYLRRASDTDHIVLSLEHRASAPIAPLTLALQQSAQSAALQIVAATAPPSASEPPNHLERVLHVLHHADQPLSVAILRQRCKIRTQRLYEALAQLRAAHRVEKLPHGYCLVST